MNIVLFDDRKIWEDLLPLTYTRPVARIRIGILTIEEKWKAHFPDANVSCYTQEHLIEMFPSRIEQTNIFINASAAPSAALIGTIKDMVHGECYSFKEQVLAYKGSLEEFKLISNVLKKEFQGELIFISKVFEIFQKNGDAIKQDFELITKGRKSASLSNSVTVIGDPSLVFAEEGVIAEACILSTKNGPIYLGKDSEVMEGSVVRGPFALCEHSALKLSAKIYGPTTIGPHSKVGGEVNNSVIFGYSNKAHDGFLGNSVLGEWCNLGADTNNSNLKNNYANVKLFNYRTKSQIDTGLQFCGLIMGDYSKSGINTMFNTGTVVGVGANVYGGGFPDTHIPSFSWGGAEGFQTYKLEKLFETSEKVFERRGLVFGDQEKKMLRSVFDVTAEYRIH